MYDYVFNLPLEPGSAGFLIGNLVTQNRQGKEQTLELVTFFEDLQNDILEIIDFVDGYLEDLEEYVNFSPLKPTVYYLQVLDIKKPVKLEGAARYLLLFENNNKDRFGLPQVEVLEEEDFDKMLTIIENMTKIIPIETLSLCFGQKLALGYKLSSKADKQIMGVIKSKGAVVC